MRYKVFVPVTGYNCYEVEADTPEEAKEAVANCEGHYLPKWGEENEDLDSNNWEVTQ